MTFKVVDHNVETNEITEREMTIEEIAEMEARQTFVANQEAEAQAKAAARQAVLDKLGLTAEEVAALLA